MSRSYKHTPIYTDGTAKSTQYTKRKANSKVRNCRDENIPTRSRAWFKRVFDQYDIHDYISYWSKRDAILKLTQDWIEEEEKQILNNKPVEEGFYHRRYCTLSNFIQHRWHKNYKRK